MACAAGSQLRMKRAEKMSMMESHQIESSFEHWNECLSQSTSTMVVTEANRVGVEVSTPAAETKW